MLSAKRLAFLVALFLCKSHHSRELHHEDAVFKITHENREVSPLSLGTDIEERKGKQKSANNCQCLYLQTLHVRQES